MFVGCACSSSYLTIHFLLLRCVTIFSYLDLVHHRAPSTDEGVYPRKHFTNITFKVIPRISDCSWIVRNAVPSNKPCILGNIVQQKYFKGENYVEIDVDIGSSTVACNVMGVIRSASKHFTGAYALVLQGAAEDELPEKVLACQDGDQPDFEHLNSINSTIFPL